MNIENKQNQVASSLPEELIRLSRGAGKKHTICIYGDPRCIGIQVISKPGVTNIICQVLNSNLRFRQESAASRLKTRR